MHRLLVLLTCSAMAPLGAQDAATVGALRREWREIQNLGRKEQLDSIDAADINARIRRANAAILRLSTEPATRRVQAGLDALQLEQLVKVRGVWTLLSCVGAQKEPADAVRDLVRTVIRDQCIRTELSSSMPHRMVQLELLLGIFEANRSGIPGAPGATGAQGTSGDSGTLGPNNDHYRLWELLMQVDSNVRRHHTESVDILGELRTRHPPRFTEMDSLFRLQAMKRFDELMLAHQSTDSTLRRHVNGMTKHPSCWKRWRCIASVAPAAGLVGFVLGFAVR